MEDSMTIRDTDELSVSLEKSDGAQTAIISIRIT
jgi:hypothetical protein